MQATPQRHNIQKHTNHCDYAGDGTLFFTKCSFFSLVLFSFILDISVGCSGSIYNLKTNLKCLRIVHSIWASVRRYYMRSLYPEPLWIYIHHRFRFIIIYGWFCYCRTNAIHFNADKRTNKWQIWMKNEIYEQALKCTHYVRITSSLYIVCVVVVAAAADFLCF